MPWLLIQRRVALSRKLESPKRESTPVHAEMRGRHRNPPEPDRRPVRPEAMGRTACADPARDRADHAERSGDLMREVCACLPWAKRTGTQTKAATLSIRVVSGRVGKSQIGVNQLEFC